MEISITFEDTSPEDLMVQHLAEQEDAGHVVDWVHGLIFAAIEAHPDFRFCPDQEECCELVYPTMTVRPVEDGTWKRYRVATAPTLLCPRCGKTTITQGQLDKAKKADPYRQECIAKAKASNRAFAEGKRVEGNRGIPREVLRSAFHRIVETGTERAAKVKP